MFKALWSMGREDFSGIEALRRETGAGFDTMDDYAAHVFVSEEDGTPIASGRLYPVSDALRIDRMTVSKAYCALPYEEFTFRVLLYRAKDLPQTTIEAEITPGLAPLLPRFGFSPAAFDPRIMTCPRNGIIWFSQCHDDGVKKT